MPITVVVGQFIMFVCILKHYAVRKGGFPFGSSYPSLILNTYEPKLVEASD